MLLAPYHIISSRLVPLLGRNLSRHSMAAVSLPSLPVLAAILLLGLVVVYSRSLILWNARSRGRPLPPGPKPLPFIGNVLNFPTTKQGAAFRDLSARYGERSTG